MKDARSLFVQAFLGLLFLLPASAAHATIECSCEQGDEHWTMTVSDGADCREGNSGYRTGGRPRRLCFPTREASPRGTRCGTLSYTPGEASEWVPDYPEAGGHYTRATPAILQVAPMSPAVRCAPELRCCIGSWITDSNTAMYCYPPGSCHGDTARFGRPIRGDVARARTTRVSAQAPRTRREEGEAIVHAGRLSPQSVHSEAEPTL